MPAAESENVAVDGLPTSEPGTVDVEVKAGGDLFVAGPNDPEAMPLILQSDLAVDPAKDPAEAINAWLSNYARAGVVAERTSSSIYLDASESVWPENRNVSDKSPVDMQAILEVLGRAGASQVTVETEVVLVTEIDDAANRVDAWVTIYVDGSKWAKQPSRPLGFVVTRDRGLRLEISTADGCELAETFMPLCPLDPS